MLIWQWACQCGKQVRRPTGPTLTTERSDEIGGLHDCKLEPGDEVAVDQCKVSKRGRRVNTAGKEIDKCLSFICYFILSAVPWRRRGLSLSFVPNVDSWHK